MINAKRTQKIVTIITVLLFVVALLVCAFGIGGAAEGFLTDLTFDGSPIRYSPMLEKRFRNSMLLFLNGVPGEVMIFSDIVTLLYNAFSEARIPSEKVEWFLSKVEEVPLVDVPSEEVPEGEEPGQQTMLLKFLKQKFARYQELLALYESGDRDTPPKFQEIVSMDELRTGVSATLSFLMGSPLTNDEMGRFFYRMAINYSADTEYAELLKKIGEKEFTTLTVGSYTVYLAVEGLVNVTSLPAARTVGQSLVALGSSYLNLIWKIGLKNVDKLFGFDYRIDENDPDVSLPPELVGSYNELLADIEGVPSGALLILGHTLSALSQTTFEEMYLAEVAKTEGDGDAYLAHRLLAAAELSKAIRNGVNRAIPESGMAIQNDRDAILLLATGYQATYKMQDILNEDMDAVKDNARYAQILQQADQRLTAALHAADTLKEIKDYKAVLALQADNPQQFLQLLDTAETLYSFSTENPEQITDVLIGVIFNLMIRNFNGSM